MKPIKRFFTISYTLLMLLAPEAVAQEVQGQDQEQKKEVRRQEFDLKTNLLSDITGSFHLGAEISLGRHWSAGFSGTYNPWVLKDGRQAQFALYRPEVKYWLGDSILGGHYLGLHGHYAYYAIQHIGTRYMRQFRYEGDLWGAGLSYGYRHNFSQRWGMEFAFGLGFANIKFSRYHCETCPRLQEKGKYFYIGPTQAAITLVYRFGKEKQPKQDLVVAEIIEEIQQIPPITVPAPLPAPKPAPTPVPLPQPKPIVRERHQEHLSAEIHYRKGESQVDSAFDNNAQALQQIAEAIHSIHQKGGRIVGITVTSHTSVEGTITINKKISASRAEKLAEYLQRHHDIDPLIVTLHSVEEDWSGLESLIMGDNSKTLAPYKAEMLRIIREVPLLNGRKSKLMQLGGGKPYLYIGKWFFPKSRYVTCSMDVEIIAETQK